MIDNKIAVLGGGNAGRAMAAYLAAIGCDVNLYNRTPENIQMIQQLGGIYLRYSPDLQEEVFPEGIEHVEAEPIHEVFLTPKTDHLVEDEVERVFGKLNRISSNLQNVIEERDVLMLAVPATAHRELAEKCAPYLKDGQMIILNPGRFFGAIEFYKTVYDFFQEKKRRMPNITVAEAQTFIYASRIYKPRSVRVLGVKNSVDIASIPSNHIDKVIQTMSSAYPQFTPKSNVLETSLSNLGGVFHVPITILNATRIDSRNAFEYYIEGITEHTASIIEDLDRERRAVAKAIDIPVISARLWLFQAYGSEGADLYEAIQNTHVYKGIESPRTVNHRYIWEEVPTSLVPLSSLAKKLEVPTPMTNSFIHQAISLLRKDLDIDFRKKGRTMDKLGLTDKSVEEIKTFAEMGEIQ